MYVTLFHSYMCEVIDYLYPAPLEKGSKLEELVVGIRKRKGLKPDVPGYENYYDKL